jgi:hypothetical protein
MTSTFTTPTPFMPTGPTQANQVQIFEGLQTLGLENGMTAGYGYPGGVTENPPLANPSGIIQVDPYGGNPAWAPNRVGLMRNVPGTVPGLGPGGYAALYFLYNPNQIGVSFNFNQSSIPPMYLYGEGGSVGNTFSQYDPTTQTNATDSANIPNLTQGQSVSWTLLFDRTYDMLYSPDPGSNRGVLKDVAALYSLLGTFESAGAVPVSTPIQVIFGITSSGDIWGFTGFLTAAQITYGIFRYDMIPSRSEVDLTMMTSYVGPVSPPSGGASKTVAPPVKAVPGAAHPTPIK